MSLSHESRISPSDIAPDEQAILDQVLVGEARPIFMSKDGVVTELPKAIAGMVDWVIRSMKEDHAVILLTEDASCTTQEAADFLGVSRQYLVRLLDLGRITFHRVGTHRRILVRDLANFRNERSRSRVAALDKMTEDLANAGVYDHYAPLARDQR